MIRFRWRTHLKQANDEAEVLILVHEYLATWRSDERACLPPAAWPESIASARDVTRWTFRLGEMHSEYHGDSEGLKRLQELWLFFTHAAVRLTQLRGASQTAIRKVEL